MEKPNKSHFQDLLTERICGTVASYFLEMDKGKSIKRLYTCIRAMLTRSFPDTMNSPLSTHVQKGLYVTLFLKPYILAITNKMVAT